LVGCLTRSRTTLSSCLPARPWSSSSHDRTAELLKSPGWALTAASCILLLLFISGGLFRATVRLARTTMEESGLTRWNVAELAVLYTLRVCLDAKDYAAPSAGAI